MRLGFFLRVRTFFSSIVILLKSLVFCRLDKKVWFFVRFGFAEIKSLWILEEKVREVKNLAYWVD